MSVQRRVNWLSQERVDVPMMRAVESSVSNDFDQLVQAFVTGPTQSYVLRGFEIAMAGAIGGASNALQLLVDPGAVFHVTSSISGTVLMVPVGTPSQQINSATNNIVDGAFTPNSTNYVSIEFERFIDDTTSAPSFFWDPTDKIENTKNVPQAQILRYRIKVSTSSPPANYLQIATVVTDSGNIVTSITDDRWSLFRLATGGSSPNPLYIYPWTAQTEGRTENPSTSTDNSANPFRGGDKMLGTLKDWMNAVMSSLKEIKGTTYWYSFASAGSLENLREDLGNTVITGKGSIAHGVLPATPAIATAAGQINWDQDINIKVIGSRLTYVLTANPSSTDITLASDDVVTNLSVAYITLVRGVDIGPNLIFTNGSDQVTSVGSVSWTTGLQAGDWIKLSTATNAKYYKINHLGNTGFANTSFTVTLTENYAESSTGASGAEAQYAFGSYSTSALAQDPDPRKIRRAARKDVPEGADVFWLFLRSDNGGTTPKVYIRFLGSELEQGEDRQVSDNTTAELLTYIGSPMESAFLPQYVSVYQSYLTGSGTVLKQITQITTGSAATMSSGQYFFLYSSANSRRIAVWVNKDASLSSPPSGVPGVNTYIQWPIVTGDTATQTATKLVTALNNILPFKDFTATSITSVVTITNNSAGSCSNATNSGVPVPAPFAIAITQTGTGSGNLSINDGDDLTLAIKRLDQEMISLASVLDTPSYDQTVDIVASGATPPTSLNGPIISGTNITLPNNARITGSPAQKYTVGKGVLQVSLNGQRLTNSFDGSVQIDWSEVGVSQSESTQIQILRNLVVGDTLKFEIIVNGGPGGGGGGTQGPVGPAGPAGAPGADAAGGPVAISTKTGNYTVLLTDNVLLANATGGSITFTLPTAASATGNIFFFKKIDSSANAMTVKGNGAELIDGVNTQSTTTQYEAFTVVTDGTAWYIL